MGIYEMQQMQNGIVNARLDNLSLSIQHWKRIMRVICWQNGQVMVFDQDGLQMPEYQGRLSEVKAKILAAAGSDTLFEIGNWNTGQFRKITREVFANT